MSIKWWHLSDTDDIPADKADIIPKGRKEPKRRQHSAMNALTDSCTPKKPRLETVDVLGKSIAHPSNLQFVHT